MSHHKVHSLPATAPIRIAAVLLLQFTTVCCAGGEVQTAEHSAQASAKEAPPSRAFEWAAPVAGYGGTCRLCGGGCQDPAAPFPIHGVDSTVTNGCGEAHWRQMGPIPFQVFAQGEYIGHARAVHVPEYRLRVDDRLEFVYRLTREISNRPYEINVGDELRVESATDATLDRQLVVQPDGHITLKLLGQVRAAGKTVEALRTELHDLYKKTTRDPAITVTPTKVDTKLDDLRQSVNSQFGTGGQVRQARVTPEGTVQLPAVGNVPVQGLTLDELSYDLALRYAQQVPGVEVTPVLTARAPRYAFVIGEVRAAGRYTLEGPTTVMQAISLAGGWTVGGNLRQIVVFRRADDWRLLATMLDLRGALYAKSPGPSDEIWLNDSDVVLVPKGPIKVADDVIEQVFVRGLYGVVPFNFNYTISNLSGVAVTGS